MQIIDANNPFLSYKAAIQFALGCKGAGRPVFENRSAIGITLVDDVDEYSFSFQDLNYKYIEEIATHDISVYTSEQFGKFFYEYGRAILANLMICLTKADWNSVSLESTSVAQYVGDYYNALLKLENKVEEVVCRFKEGYINENDGDYMPYKIDYTKAAEMIKAYKEIVARSMKSTDMPNTDIFYIAYVGLMFVLYGVFILFSQVQEEFDFASFMKAPKSTSFLSVYDRILKANALNGVEKTHIVSLVYAFYKMTDFYRRTSGMEKMDSFVGTMFNISEIFVSKFENSDSEEGKTLFGLIDEDLTSTAFASGLSLQTFAGKYDPLLDFGIFKNGVVISKDNPNIFEFGAIYRRSYETKNLLDDEDTVTGFMKKEWVLPAIKTYLNGALKSAYTNEDVERAFGTVKNLLTGIEDPTTFSNVEPGFILQLVMLASSFRVLHNRSTQRSNKAMNEVNAAIDILDVMILKLYNIWFKSHKYYIQPNRPNYCLSGNTGINSTLHELEHETLSILKYYFEFVAYGVGSIQGSDEAQYESWQYQNTLIVGSQCGTNEEYKRFIQAEFPYTDAETFIGSCGSKNGKTITEFIVFPEDKSFENIVKHFEKQELPKYIINTMSKTPEQHVGIDPIDRIIDISIEAEHDSGSNPQIYAIAIYATLYYIFDTILRKFNTGNYFDFGDADNSLGSYFIEHTVAKLVGVPLKKAVTYNGL